MRTGVGIWMLAREMGECESQKAFPIISLISTQISGQCVIGLTFGVKRRKSYTAVMLEVVAAAAADETRVNHVALGCPLQRQPALPLNIRRVSYLIYVSMRHYILTTSGDIVVCFHTAVCLSC